MTNKPMPAAKILNELHEWLCGQKVFISANIDLMEHQQKQNFSGMRGDNIADHRAYILTLEKTLTKLQSLINEAQDER